MAGTKKPENNKGLHNPFRRLKGFAVSEEPAGRLPAGKANIPDLVNSEDDPDFGAAMAALGIVPLDHDEPDLPSTPMPIAKSKQSPETLSDDEVFRRELGRLDVCFEDHVPEPALVRHHAPRRMKQVRRGTLVPQATLDLHGLQRRDVEARLTMFLQNAGFHGWDVVLVITGKGLHSADGEPVLRQAVEEFLDNQGREQVVEWGRAPRQYGGEGALVLFLRR